MLTRLRFLSAGESHGPCLTAIVDGLPAGIPLRPEDINEQLARRQRGYGSGGRMHIEQDEVTISAGWMAGKTTGGPLAMTVVNRDFATWRDKSIAPMTIPRPGHADLTGAIKYGYRDLRLSLERASARETVARVAAGAVCRQVLKAFSIEVGGYVAQIGDVKANLEIDVSDDVYRTRFRTALDNDVCCADPNAASAMRTAIAACRKSQDTLGGVFEVIALGLPPGLGSHTQWDRRLEARLAMAFLSIQAMKGIEFGPAFDNAGKVGSEVHDEIFKTPDGDLYRETNRAGGVEGGITTGAPLVARVAMKPISTTLNPRRSVNLANGQPEPTTYERSDFCAVPRAVPIGESMAALVLADALLEKLGGDSLDEMLRCFESLRRSRVSDVPMDNVPWNFGYR